MTDEIHSLAQSRTESAGHYDLREELKFYAWAVWGIGFLVAVATAFIVRTQFKLSEYQGILDVRGGKIEKFDAYIVSNNIVNITVANAASSLQARVNKNESRLDKIEPLVTDMDFMKRHGISNKEDFFLQNHRPAPSDPDADKK